MDVRNAVENGEQEQLSLRSFLPAPVVLQLQRFHLMEACDAGLIEDVENIYLDGVMDIIL